MHPIFASVLNPQGWLESGGLLLATAIVFAETGLLVGFFLPGDSLLFVSGFLASDAGGHRLPALPWVLLCLALAAVIGDQVGYFIGRKAGPALFDRPESRLFKPQHVVKAHDFLERHGPFTIVLARFVPIVRTFAPVVAGVGKMHYRTFVMFNVIGGIVWALGVTIAGYYFGHFQFVKDNIEVAILAVIAISLSPVAIEYLRHRGRERKLAGSTPDH
ncbi:MAG: associated protein [Acidimicrobiia bacterium]|nr:associated protein [Acidimicrobiia bacterium]